VPRRVDAHPCEDAISVALVSAALLGGSAALAERMAAVATALLEGEGVEGLPEPAISADLRR